MNNRYLLSLLCFVFSMPLFAQDYAVQLGAYIETVSSNYFEVHGIQEGVYMERDHNNFYRYYVGKYTNKAEAEKRASEVVAAGLPSARVVDLTSIRNCMTACGTVPTEYNVGCTKGNHVVYNPPADPTSFKDLAKLGTNPQFGTLRFYTTTQEVYDHLKKAYVTNEKGNARELDKLWNAMGYQGFNDPRFLVTSITPVFYDAGIKGMLGAGGNTYLYARVSQGQNIQLKGYQITAVDGCDVTIMEICGNAFYPDYR